MSIFRRHGGKPESEYRKKEYLMSAIEWEFFGCLNKLLAPSGYVVQPHVPLMSVIEKLKHFASRHEDLHDVIDFCIFDDDYHPLLFIEVDEQGEEGDGSKTMDRVREVLAEAKVPLVTFWTNYGADEEYIRERLRKYLKF